MQRPFAWFALLGALAMAGCGDSIPQKSSAFCPPDCPLSAATAQADGAGTASAQAPIPPNLFDPSAVQPVLGDLRLAGVKAEVEKEQYAKAAALLGTAIAGQPASSPDRPAWLYQLGKLRALGGDPGGAAKAFEESANASWVLSDWARLQAAQWYVGIDQPDHALAQAGAIKPDPALDGALDLVTADALLAKNDVDGALARFRAYLGRDRHPPQWVNVSLRFANTLIHHPTATRAEEAYRVAQRVELESTAGAGAAQAREIQKQALATIPFKERKALETPSSEELLRRAKALVASRQSKEALATLQRIGSGEAAPPPKPARKGKKGSPKPAAAASASPPAAGDFACEVRMTKAEALKSLRKKAEAADGYLDAVDACAGSTRRAEALFNAGRTLSQAGRGVEAIKLYAKLEKEFPKHRLADDARLRGAMAALDTNDVAHFADLLKRMPDDYPEGDMVNDGLFALALTHLTKGDLSAASSVLQRALDRTPRERAYFAAGRLPYFLARVELLSGRTAEGEARLASVIRDYPLTYYMALAYARLADKNRTAADRALSEALAREPQGPFLLPRGSWQEAPAYRTAVELARQGDAKSARAELDRLGVGTRTAPRELTWAATFLFAKAGAPTLAHGILRASNATASSKPNEVNDWLDHYPVGAWRAPWELAFPRPYETVVTAAAKREGMPEALAHAIMREESAFDARVVSPAKAFGLMQLIVPTAKKMAEPLRLPWDEESLKRPDVNVPLGCRYLAQLRAQFADNPLLAIPGYNAGGGAPKKWIGERPGDDFDVWVERIPYEETRFYTKRVITSLAAYEFLYARDKPSEALRAPMAASPAAKGGASASGPPLADMQ